MSVSTETQTRNLFPVGETRAKLGDISHTTFYELKKSGRIRTVKIGRRTFVTAEEIDRFVASLTGGDQS